MANTVRNFIAGRMNKTLDERLVPNGEYIDALNIRLGSTEASEVGSVENSLGNSQLTTVEYIDGSALSSSATCIGAYADGEQETMYWFIHDNNFTGAGTTGKLDLIVSYNTSTDTLTYHVISIDDGGGVKTTLNFSNTHLITGVNLVENLLFFTDDLNQPRRINVQKNYGNPVANVDAFLASDILVVKAPPITSPVVVPFEIDGEENFLEDRFICFAYRYKYEDNEYSATSQFSEPSFVPSQYELSSESFLNEGMVNLKNATRVTFNSGGSLVVGVDLLFKDMVSDTIKVIEKINKSEEGYADNTDYTITFANSKIYTVLPSSEILRLYDNVPLVAKAQAVMGNRLNYGNYADGFDLIAPSGFNTQFTYETSRISQAVGFERLTSSRSSGTYTVNGTQNIANSVLEIDFSAAASTLVSGSTIDLSLSFTHSTFSGSVSSFPIEQSVDRQLNFVYTLTQDYATIDELYNSADFQAKVGTSANILPVYAASGETSCDGLTLTDLFNCAITDSLQGGNPSPVFKYASGISVLGNSVATTHAAGTNIIGFQFPAMQYVDSVTSPTSSVFEYYTVSATNLTFSALGSPTSLHSNRGYEIGIVYMDEFNRATTALVSPDNTVFVPCSASADKNSIRVTIPTTQVAPAFASRYKFVIKPDESTYETVYSSTFFYDTVTASDYFLLQGENAAKIEEGDRLIVKRDVDGPLGSCTYATVLEKKAQSENFITVTDAGGTAINVPAGVYMQIRSSSFNSTLTEDAFFNVEAPSVSVGATQFAKTVINFSQDTSTPVSGVYPVLNIPSGSTIRLKFDFNRRGTGDGNNNCERRQYKFDESYTASQTYNSIIDWFNGDNIAETLNNGVSTVGGNGCDIQNIYEPVTATTNNPNPPIPNYFYGINPNECVNYYRWYQDPTSNEIRFAISGTLGCGNSEKKRSRLRARIELLRAENTIVFETEPQDALADVWYESSDSYSIDALGNHSGNVTNQDISAGISGVVDTAFFNCFSFGNGVESYKIRDSIAGRALALGNRVTTVAAQDYKRADRFSDITYSGVFNSESNVNKLNEFNLGLLNFKVLEESFGPIEKMSAQDTNILVLQEDKISYVLASKNLISDSTGGGVVSSVPEILGTQIARPEEFGISNNPESYAEWGRFKYFTDAKRGAVIQLSGSGPNEQLTVISEIGMRGFFRDLFITNFSSQKLGGYDPYMNEFVLGNNTTTLPEFVTCIECGVTRNYSIPAGGLSVCYDLGNTVGLVPFSWTVGPLTDNFSFAVTYNNNTTNYGPFTAAGSVNIPKTSVSAQQLDVVMSVGSGPANISLTVGCPNSDNITIVLVTLTNNSDSGKTIHNQYRWTDGNFVSPTHSNQVTFTNSTDPQVVSQYTSISGLQGGGIIPADAAAVTMISNKLDVDTFNLDPTTDKFLFLRSNVLYSNTPASIQSLVAASTSINPTGSTPQYTGNFSMPAGSDNDYLYLIWDYAAAVRATLCYSASTPDDACCQCTCAAGVCTEWQITNGSNQNVVLAYETCGGTKTNLTLPANSSTIICVDGNVSIVHGPTEGVSFDIVSCDCT